MINLFAFAFSFSQNITFNYTKRLLQYKKTTKKISHKKIISPARADDVSSPQHLPIKDIGLILSQMATDVFDCDWNELKHFGGIVIQISNIRLLV